MTEPGLYYLGNTRTEAQAERMRELEEAGICLFCSPTIDQEPAEGLVLANEHWVVRHNDFPYRGARLHLLCVPRRHVTDLVDLPDAALADYWQVIRTLRERFGLTYYGLGVRCGDCAYTGGTIAHVHAHLIAGDPESEHPVRLKLSSRPGPALHR
ncbi:HIT family protein [Kineosporia rhizophila]|uniref:HIT family protein n=1 Tax=Kineosporia rhizophila TaxID=84633 RepID=UPI001E3C7DCB|nr:HIT family protein [Kineosporia rhizophila]